MVAGRDRRFRDEDPVAIEIGIDRPDRLCAVEQGDPGPGRPCPAITWYPLELIRIASNRRRVSFAAFNAAPCPVSSPPAAEGDGSSSEAEAMPPWLPGNVDGVAVDSSACCGSDDSVESRYRIVDDAGKIVSTAP